MYRSVILAPVFLALLTVESAWGDEEAVELPPPARVQVDHERHIAPILATRCYRCHGPEKQKGGLRLDARRPAVDGGDSGPVILPGKSAASVLIQRVSSRDPDKIMPPSGKPLSREEIGLLRAWIDQGAGWAAPPAPAPGGRRRQSDHWSFQKLLDPEVPRVKDTAWVRNPIDAFVLRSLERLGVKPSPEADRATLLRRLHLDLTGLPPPVREVEEFLIDDAPDRYERLVERLLASPHFGERWGRHWLDLARYADSDGYEKDRIRPHAWRYRNWVIDAINADVPFDQFTVEQLAGDLLANATVEQRVATGFHRNTLTNTEGGADKEEDRVKATVDRTNTTGSVWLGLTIGCAQCHNHKYDPITQREYYQLFAFFNTVSEVNIEAPLPAERHAPKKPPTQAQTLSEHTPRRETRVLTRGDFLRPGARVDADTPAVLPPFESRGTVPDRLDLARWLIGPENPLTPRVAANRIWQHLFGRGIVRSPEDFGTRGDRPSHPELLDWLALESMLQGWSLKRMVRMIVMSSTYRQRSASRPDLLRIDAENHLLARQNRFRLEAEVVRDVFLASSGLMTRVIGGPSVRPPLPPGVRELGYADSIKWPVSTGPDRYRRGLYVFFQRTVPYPMLIVFDAPDSNVTCVRRRRSNTPLQALTLLNDPVFHEGSKALGQRVVHETAGNDVAARVRHLFLLAVSRDPDPREQAKLEALYRDLRAEYRKHPEEAARMTQGLTARPEVSARAVEMAAWIAVARVVLNLDEVVTRN